MTYKATMAPSCICDLLQVHQPNLNLRSASRGLSLVVPPHQTQAYGARSFSVAVPTLWNSLPVDIKMRNLCLFLKRSSKHFYLINFTPSFITFFFLLCILFISYICKFICIILLFYFLYLSSALRLGSCAI